MLPASTLFVVDDDPIYHRIIKLTLLKGPVFKHALYFYEATSFLKNLSDNRNDASNLPDVIFLDLNMPILDGWAALETIQKLYPSLSRKPAVYVVSASIMDRDKKRALKYDFVREFISKPLYRDKIIAIGSDVKDNAAS